ncbi:unnamed protein product [Alopecurus aequalis]
MEGERKVKEEKTHDVPWQLVKLGHCPKKKQVHAVLKLPSVQPRRYSGEWVRLPVRLVLHSNNGDAVHALTIMRDSTGSNILQARLVTEGPSGLHAWVEPFCGNLEYYLRSSRLGIPGNRGPEDKFVLPSHNVRSAVGGLVDGMKQLILAGLYHGNLSLANTYYTMDEKDPNTLEVKLCNFRKKPGTYKKKLAEDWKAIRAGLRQIRRIADTLKQAYPNIDCCQLDGLIDCMGRINSNAEVAFEVIRKQPFFWGREEWKSFFIQDIPLALTEPQFRIKVQNANLIDLPWNRNIGFSNALAVMDAHRESKGKKAYDTKSPVAFVKCVSGLFTHEALLKLGKRVDEIIEDHCPDIYYKLYVLLPRAKT